MHLEFVAGVAGFARSAAGGVEEAFQFGLGVGAAGLEDDLGDAAGGVTIKGPPGPDSTPGTTARRASTG